MPYQVTLLLYWFVNKNNKSTGVFIDIYGCTINYYFSQFRFNFSKRQNVKSLLGLFSVKIQDGQSKETSCTNAIVPSDNLRDKVIHFLPWRWSDLLKKGRRKWRLPWLVHLWRRMVTIKLAEVGFSWVWRWDFTSLPIEMVWYYHTC